ncbi:MAG: DUF4367 domain-containing protein [Hespellia sp.]|nr:DUF4367 domain-containing protein [Hespellia sp.]
MKDKKILSLQKEMEEEARRIEQAVLSDPNLQDLEVTEEMNERHYRLVAEYQAKKAEREARVAKENDPNQELLQTKMQESEADSEFAGEIGVESVLSEQDRKALEIGRQVLAGKSPVVETAGEMKKVRRMPRKRKVAFALVAVMVLVLAVGMTSVGSRQYLKEVWEKMLGKQAVVVTSTEDTDNKKLDEIDAANVYKEIDEKLGINAVKLGVLPRGMQISDVEIDEEQGSAKIFYLYEDQICIYSIYANGTTSSKGQKMEDNLKGTFRVTTEKQSVAISEYLLDNDTEQTRLVAEYEYQGVQYQLMGIMKKSEFEGIIKKLFYL